MKVKIKVLKSFNKNLLRFSVFGEAVRLRHLNERKSDYLKKLVSLKYKCLRLNFNQKMTENMLEIYKH